MNNYRKCALAQVIIGLAFGLCASVLSYLAYHLSVSNVGPVSLLCILGAITGAIAFILIVMGVSLYIADVYKKTTHRDDSSSTLNYIP